jgi:GNAT superfamily N-acetyltransferase
MADFYAEAGYPLDLERASRAFADVIGDEKLGYAWIIEADGQDVGHIVLTVRYAMEYCGLIACVDDLFVTPPWRNRGLSSAALSQVREYCHTAGLHAMTVETGHDNAPAQKVYRRAEFEEARDRALLTLPLTAPAHALDDQ